MQIRSANPIFSCWDPLQWWGPCAILQISCVLMAVVARWPNRDIVLSFGLGREELEEALDEVADPAMADIQKVSNKFLIEFKQNTPAAVEKDDEEFIKIRPGTAAIPRTPKFTDVSIIAGLDGSTHKAHRVILAARLPALAAKLHQEAVTVDDVNGTTLDALLEAVYSQGPLTCDEATAASLLTVARQLEESRLIELCESRIAKEIRDLHTSRSAWPEPVPGLMGTGNTREPLKDGEKATRLISVRRLLSWLSLATTNDAHQLIVMLKYIIGAHAFDMCEAMTSEDKATLVNIAGDDFYRALHDKYESTLTVMRMVRHPQWDAGIQSMKGVSAPLTAYLEAGGTLKAGDPEAPMSLSPVPKKSDDFEPWHIALDKLENALSDDGLQTIKVPLEIMTHQPYERGGKTLEQLAKVLLPHTYRTAAEIRVATSTDEDGEEIELSPRQRERLGRAYLADIKHEKNQEAEAKRSANLLVRYEKGERAAQVALFTGNTAAGAFADDDTALDAASMRHMSRMGGAGCSGAALGTNPHPRVVLRGLQTADLNGMKGRAMGTDTASGRIKVQLDDGRPGITVKPENILYGDKNVTTCALCHKEEREKKFSRCGKCKLAAYCSSEC